MNADQFDALQSAAEAGIDTETVAARTDGETYDFAVPEASYTGLSDDELRAAARRHREYVTEWFFWTEVAPEPTERRAFVRWVEQADDQSVPERRERLQDGIRREWGQLEIRVKLAEAGRRVYHLHHVDDSDERVEDLTVYTDPHEARGIRKYDGDGRYRPLSTAPTLRRGWAFVDLTPAALVETIETFYPATIANWHREQEGKLDVTHWHDAVSRQTGIYGVVETWDRGEGTDHVEWVAEACCADSQCLKRREWDYDEETPLDADGGEGTFPCREPCSLVVSAARKWTRIDAEESQTYEFELTPSEKEQLEELIDAVADGRTEEIREADFSDGANRWRARFLRAKLFEDDNLDGVPTGDGGAAEGDH